MKWVSNGDRVHDNRTGWAATTQSNFTASRIVGRHNADIDALTAEIDQLKATDHYQRSLDEMHLRYNAEAERDELQRRLEDVVGVFDAESLAPEITNDIFHRPTIDKQSVVRAVLAHIYRRQLAIAEGRTE